MNGWMTGPGTVGQNHYTVFALASHYIENLDLFVVRLKSIWIAKYDCKHANIGSRSLVAIANTYRTSIDGI